MPLTLDQQRKLIQAAKAKDPNLTPDQAKALIARANQVQSAGSKPQEGIAQATPAGPGPLGVLQNISESGPTLGRGASELAKILFPAKFGPTGVYGQVTTGVDQRRLLNQEIPASEERQQESARLTELAKQTKDPAQREALLKASRRITEEDLARTSGITQVGREQMELEFGESPPSIARTVAADALENAALLAPSVKAGVSPKVGAAALQTGQLAPAGAAATQVLPGAMNVLKRVGAAGITGLARGGASGVSSGLLDPSAQAGDIAQKGAKTGITSALLSSLLAVGGEGIRAAGNAMRPTPPTPLDDKADQIDKIISQAEEAKFDKKQKPSGVLRKIYQSAFPFSKKGHSVERLKPDETIEKMIEWEIGGTSDQVRMKTSQLTGKDAIFTNVVDNAILDAPADVPLPNLPKSFENSLVDTYGAESRPEVQQQLSRVASVRTGDIPGNVKLEALVELRRKLMDESFGGSLGGGHRLAAMRGNEKAATLFGIKMELADELEQVINQAVGDESIQKFVEDPRLYQEVAQIGSKRLADEFAKSSKLSDVVSLQSDLVRMNQIAALTDDMPSSLGQRFFRLISQMPLVGTALDAVLGPVTQRLNTGVAIAGNKIAQSGATRGAGAALQTLGSPQAVDLLTRLGVLPAARNIVENQEEQNAP